MFSRLANYTKIRRHRAGLIEEEAAVPVAAVPAAWRAEVDRVVAAFHAGHARLVVWGLRERLHTHRYIHKAFYETARKLGLPVTWLEDTPRAARELREGDLVIAVNVAGAHLPARHGIRYCLHNFRGSHDALLARLDPDAVLHLQVFTRRVLEVDAQPLVDDAWYAPARRILYQAWGADLLPWEFHAPVFAADSVVVNWVGSIWNNALGQGNTDAMAELERCCTAHGLRLVHVEQTTRARNIELMRDSRLAPAIAGRWQVENAYLPCRLFKNISYGCLGITNVGHFRELFGADIVCDASIAALVDAALGMRRDDCLAMTARQQQVAAGYTCLSRLRNIIACLARGGA